MFARIVVPLDGSVLAEQVLPHVEALAKQFRSTVTLLRATPPPGLLITESAGTLPVGVPGGAVVDPTPLVDAQRREAAAYLEAVVARLQGQGVAADTDLPDGTAAEAITDRARLLRADLIAMTTHGRGGLGRLVFGSVADAVLRRAPCPVLLVRVTDHSADAG
jgi:nucleotide-binding universal stress UspA family protein